MPHGRSPNKELQLSPLVAIRERNDAVVEAVIDLVGRIGAQKNPLFSPTSESLVEDFRSIVFIHNEEQHVYQSKSNRTGCM
jgi:hypothetical protein